MMSPCTDTKLQFIQQDMYYQGYSCSCFDKLSTNGFAVHPERSVREVEGRAVGLECYSMECKLV